jgi:hypothetical protein
MCYDGKTDSGFRDGIFPFLSWAQLVDITWSLSKPPQFCVREGLFLYAQFSR